MDEYMFHTYLCKFLWFCFATCALILVCLFASPLSLSVSRICASLFDLFDSPLSLSVYVCAGAHQMSMGASEYHYKPSCIKHVCEKKMVLS